MSKVGKGTTNDLPSANTRSNIPLRVMAPGGASGVEAVGDLVNSWEMVGAANVHKGMRMMGSSMPTAASATTLRREAGIGRLKAKEGGGVVLVEEKVVESRCCCPFVRGETLFATRTQGAARRRHWVWVL